MLQTDYQNYIHLSRYARWQPELGRRETWEDTTSRYIDFLDYHIKTNIAPAHKTFQKYKQRLLDAIRNLDIMPSMRAMMTAGPALERDNMAGYNCCYRAIDDISAFDEVMYCLLCGSGVGFSVERQYIANLPIIAEDVRKSNTMLVVEDSKLGWCNAFRELIHLLYSGRIPQWDMSKVRPAGSVLKTFGGRASGPEPLEDLFNFSVYLFTEAAGRRLTSIEAHDLICKIGSVVVVGGVRRAALISLSNLSDDRMRSAKSGQWWDQYPHRALANNSVAYTEKPEMRSFMKEWYSLYESKSGERGIFSRPAAKAIAERSGRRDPDHDFGTNPCSEIILRNKQCCNLTEAVIKADDKPERIQEKIELATILGTIQSTFTNFRYLSNAWKMNSEEERLLGVSLTGIMDNPYTNGDFNDHLHERLQRFKEKAVVTNKEWAGYLGINQSAAITCVKPSGTVSQLVNSASGMHARFAPYYTRRVRSDIKDPITRFMQDSGFVWEEDVTNTQNVVFEFPMASPETSKMTEDLSAIDQLNMWATLQDNWCEHKPSCTVQVEEDEWMEVGSWVFKNFNKISGVSFLPKSDHIYRQAPYQELDEEDYKTLLDKQPTDVNWSNLSKYETEDYTKGSQELACSAGFCEVA